jgi:hypothetical protein
MPAAHAVPIDACATPGAADLLQSMWRASPALPIAFALAPP